MPHRDILVIGGSAGGVEALSRLVQTLPANLAAAVFVVIHIPAYTISILPEILSRHGRLKALHPRDGEPIEKGQIYVAPPDFHMLLRPGQIHLVRGPRENHCRPAIDPLFRSAARFYGRRVIGVVLTGQLYDGTAGLMAIRNAGGLAVVQDPADAPAGVMPQTALTIAGADHVLPLAQIGPTLAALVHDSPNGGNGPMAEPEEKTAEHVSRDMAAQVNGERVGELAVMTCPECGGALWQIDDDKLVRFRCHIGHAYYAENLLAEQAEALEAALWTAVRIFKEKAVLAGQLASQAQAKGEAGIAERYADQAKLSERYSELIQQYILGGAAGTPSPQPESEPIPPPA
jgi:two-component system chemotaxis response regulator CheB